MPYRDYRTAPSRNQVSAWSVLVGCTSSEPRFKRYGGIAGRDFHNLRLHRFSVNGDGLVLGNSNDLLQLISRVSPVPDTVRKPEFASAVASLVRKQLYIVCSPEPVLKTVTSGRSRAIQVPLPTNCFVMDIGGNSVKGLQQLPFSAGSYQAVSAGGRLWVPAVLHKRSSKVTRQPSYQLVVYLLKNNRSWSEFKRVDFPYSSSLDTGYGGSTLQGYVVIRDRFILLSFINSSIRFFCLDCITGNLDPVIIDSKSRTDQYVPISGKGVHMELTNSIYFIRGSKLFSYTYSPEESNPLAAPLEIDTIWPYHEDGYGFIVALDSGLMCAVWINMDRPCGCTMRHAIITTLVVNGFTDTKTDSFVPSGVDILHSTCRRIDMGRSEAASHECYDTFCFLQ